MNNWKVGIKEKLNSNPNFILYIERLKGAVISKRFNAENFKFKVSLEPLKEKKIILNDQNVDYVRESLMTIFEKIKRSFKKRNGKTYIQLNLSFNGLKKVFLKSGIVDLFDPHSKNIVFWLINQLDQVQQSSEDLVFSNNFVCDFILIKTNHPNGKMDLITNSGFRSNNSKNNYFLSVSKKFNVFFSNYVKQGFVDMKLFFNDIFEDTNCLFVSIYFGVLFNINSQDFKRTIDFVNDQFQSIVTFEKKFKTKYKIFDEAYLKTKTISYVLHYLSIRIKQDILLFSFLNGNNLKMFYATDNYKNTLPIKLLLDKNHCVFIFDYTNLEGKRFIFCDFCRKSFTNIIQHKCKRDKCINCHLYLTKLNENMYEKICFSKIIKDTFIQCNNCKKIMVNTECADRHKKLTMSNCSFVMFCIVCEKNFSKNKNHECGKKFCKKCFSVHSSQLFCATKLKKKKSIQSTIFLCDFKFESDLVHSITISQFEKSNQIILFQFKVNDNFYTKIVIDRSNFKIVSEIKYDYNSRLDIEDIIQEIDIVNLKPTFLLDKKALNFLMNTLDLYQFKIYAKNSNVYKIATKFYTISTYQEYINFDEVYILKQLGIDLCPFYLIEPNVLKNYDFTETLTNITIDDFTKKYVNSDLSMYEYLQSNQGKLLELVEITKNHFFKISSITKLIVFFEAFEKMDSFLKIVSNNMDKKLKNRINKYESLFKFPSFSSAIFSIFLSSITKQKLPTLPSIVPGTIYNTSKYEIAFCKVLNDHHKKKFKNHSICSYVNGDGRQFQIGKLSVDWYCEECKTCIFIEGNFKFICKNHENTVKHVFKNKERKLLAAKGLIKRKTFQNVAKDKIKKTYVIGQCCILKNDYNQDFKNSNLYYSDFGKDVINELSNFRKEEYIRMNFQNALTPPFTVSLKDKFISDGISYANKYDISSAYLSVLTQQSFKLPVSNIPEKNLVNKDANYFFHNLDLNDENFAFVKAFVVKNNEYALPYIPYKCDKNIISYTNCSKCLKQLCKEKCLHSDNERGHFMQGYLNDFLYMKSLGYKIKVCQLIYFKSEHNQEMHFLAEQLLEARNDKCKFINKIGKLAALIGLGRFALNISKNTPSDVSLIKSNQELCLLIENNKIQNIDFCNNYVISFNKRKLTNYENAQISSRLNCCSAVFGMVSSAIRKEMFQFYLWTKSLKDNHIEMLRIDTDSVIIQCTKKEYFELIENYISSSKFKYKIEMSNITTLLSYGRKSHFYINSTKKVLKVCGLSLSSYQRNNLNTPIYISNKYSI